MKIVVLLSRIPYPLEKGDKLRAYHQLKQLHKNHEIILCCLNDNNNSDVPRDELKSICNELHVFNLSKFKIALNLFFALFSSRPFQVAYFYQRSVHKRIKALINKHQPDHIYCQLIRTTEYAKNEHEYIKTLDYQDAFSKGMDRRKERSKGLKKWIFETERKRLLAYENIIFEYFENRTIISKQDRNFIYHPKQKEIKIIPNGVDTAFFKPRKEPAKYHILFTGNMSYAPNIDSVLFLTDEILPLLKKVNPDIRILIAGSSPSKQVRELSSEHVIVSGWLDDIRDAYAQSTIFVAPMQIGTGLQNKLLEAMSMAMPCVTTKLANNALAAEPGKSILIGNTATEFAAHINNLLQNKVLQNEIGNAGREYVLKNFSWQKSTDDLEAILLGQNSL